MPVPSYLPAKGVERRAIPGHAVLPDYNPAVVRRTNTKPGLRPFKGVGHMRECASSETDWFPVEFLIYYDDRDKLRAFAYVRNEDGSDVPDGEYYVVDELGEHRRKWKKWNGKWQVRWRDRWSKRS
jgi:hypothetical protein